MHQLECIERLGVWEGYRVAAVERLEAGPHRPRAEVWFELHAVEGRRLVCDGCGGVVSAIHDTTERHIRDLPVLPRRIYGFIAAECCARGAGRSSSG